MAVCFKCKAKVDINATVCLKCGAALTPVKKKKEGGTLDAGQLLQQKEDVKEPLANDSMSTLEPQDMPQAESSPSETLLSPVDPGEAGSSDGQKTLRIAGDGNEEPLKSEDGGTYVFSDNEVRSAMGELGDSGSSGQLKRVWAEAIGTSGKDSKQSLRHERAEASDSVFRRVATRQVMDANAAESEGADYQIQDKLGEGGMGIVFSALQTAVNRIVAIKSIRSDKRDSDVTRKQFFYEAEVTAELDHPNIPPIYELGRANDGLLFYSMKLIRGMEWQSQLSTKSREENLEIFAKISDAVSFAHSRSVIHRDLKPANVMLGTFGEVYLTDWGLAINKSKKKSVEFGGTPDFMSPEMARNQRDDIGTASDVYLLGGILFQIVTGGPPHIGRTAMDRLRAASRNEIAPTDKEDPLLEIAYHAMATEPSDRYASVEDLQEAIREVTRHAESIALANRSEELATSAESSKDYDRFTRSIFGFRDAIELWSGNKPAIAGLQKARYAFGRCAFDKGDYDLALQTLDRSVDEEARIYDKAAKAKVMVEQRESRFKTLKRAFVAAVSVLLLVASGFAILAYYQKGEAEKNLVTANEQKELAEGNFKEAEKQKNLAERNLEKAVEQEKLAVKNFGRAETQTKLAERNLEKAVEEEHRATANFERAEVQTKLANENFKTAEAQTKLANAKTLEVSKKAAQIQLNNFISEIGKAKLSTEQLDIQGASRLLRNVQSMDPKEFAGGAPSFDSFALHRVSLLTNSDLPQQGFGEKISAMDFALNGNIGIIGTEKGKLRILRYVEGVLKIDDSIKEDFDGANVECVAISPRGDEAVMTVSRAGKSSSYAWQLTAGQKPVQAEFLEARSFQAMKYSPDGTRIAAGIVAGVWMMPAGSKWSATTSAEEINLMRNVQDVRGKLTDIHWLDPTTLMASAFIGADANKELKLFKIDANTKSTSTERTSQVVSIPQAFSQRLTAAVQLPGNRLMLATNDGKLTTCDLAASSNKDGKQVLTVSNLAELPTKHRASVSKLIANADGRIISISDKEPVAYVWQSDTKGSVSYDTYLTGVPSNSSETTASTSTSNLSNALFVAQDLIVGMDDEGTTMVWNVERQKQRRQLTRISDTGPEVYAKPVVSIFGRGKTDQAISITQDGVVDLWNIQSGKTQKIDGNRWSYFGHTPGAEFVDSAVDMTQGVVVTSATLKNAEKRYLADPSHDWEVCVWNQTTGNMLHRWSRKAEANGKADKIEPRISLLNSGREILISSDVETRIVSLDGSEVLRKDNLGTLFAVPNPKDPSMIAMVKRSGFTWLWNRSDSASWESNPFFYSEDRGGFPLKGVWSEDGNRFFVAYSIGVVKAYNRMDRKLSGVVWSSEVAASVTDKDIAQRPWRTSIHYDMDIAAVRTAGSIDRLFVNVRNPGVRPTFSGAVFDFPAGDGKPTIADKYAESGVRWLAGAIEGQATLSRKIHNRYDLNEKAGDRVLARFKTGDHTFVSTKSGVVYDLQDESAQMKSNGRAELVSSSSDRDGKVIVALLQDGSLWRFELSDQNAATWTKAAYLATGAESVHLSPDAKQLAVLDKKSHALKLLDAVAGTLIQEFANVSVAVWDPMADANLAVSSLDGKLEIVSGAGREVLSGVDLADGAKVKSLHFFKEKLMKEKEIAEVRYLLVQMEDERPEVADGFLQFVRLKPSEIPNESSVSGKKSVKKGLKIAASPEESVFATGDDAGTVTIWFASPKWDNLGAELFDLEGHRGASIESIGFSRDGQTLITSDSNNRLFGWLSSDSSVAKRKP